MAMDGNVLANAVKSRILEIPGYANFANGAMGPIIDVICDEVIKHIKEYGVVSTNVSTTVIGTLPSGPVAATGTGEGSGGIE